MDVYLHGHGGGSGGCPAPYIEKAERHPMEHTGEEDRRYLKAPCFDAPWREEPESPFCLSHRSRSMGPSPATTLDE
jgi:hypothetical protein